MTTCAFSASADTSVTVNDGTIGRLLLYGKPRALAKLNKSLFHATWSFTDRVDVMT